MEPDAPQKPASTHTREGLTALVVGAIGVVFGDIGTSPIYAFRECFTGVNGLAATQVNVLGIASLVFWSLILLISVKYLIFLLSVDIKGEGGVLVLFTLVAKDRRTQTHGSWAMLVLLGLFGSALLYGDGILTPAISVLSAVEGLNVATNAFAPYVVYLSLGILVALFLVQHKGTARIGSIFGPILIVWFIAIGIIGAMAICSEPKVLAAVNPAYALEMFMANKWKAFVVLGTVFLCVTGGEVLYADMGHFGKRPIRVGWFAIAFPAVLLSYFGQAAHLLGHPGEVENLFYRIVPGDLHYPFVGLATMATVIASQSVISGTFSLTRQAIQLGYLPRMRVIHTSESLMGQVYVPAVNWALLAGIVALILEFKTSGSLAGAYGVAVSATMLITTLLAMTAAPRIWNVKAYVVAPVAAVFIVINLAFFAACSLKTLQGGWIPLLIGSLAYVLMSVWSEGRRAMQERAQAESMPLDLFIKDVAARKPTRVPGAALFMSANENGIPRTLLHNFKHNKVLHESIIFMAVKTEEVPSVPDDERMTVRSLGEGFHQAVVRYGFSEEPNITKALQLLEPYDLERDANKITFFLGGLHITRRKKTTMAGWRRSIYMTMSRNALDASYFYKIPANRVVVMGIQVEI